mmetsp:Transcript_32919/g.72716  ORF Transcript_32919/g.72716 Transcript_32919/m.72716 type:complete len:205 (+) Transcript_32919:668-1282(+)|eukprot:CAMPEP_0202899986 /NCGR_PEP_ID=MMETSP1392-20130828/9365_1 /ASSEMBLY_ACC=CAM_ASM_000868 /TAXON_ID=225041 /ORGANISM="Chlamydomonas chlamydogama, Strain SAG 11-48b" /LENGTH=204 /DNA_ID=CAMNT_0049586293 /DNA_START=668 /DNA_END=1282 /DNA_ORIENTATION=-
MATIFGVVSVEMPKYAVLKKTSAFEIRNYSRQLRAMVTEQSPAKDVSTDSLFGVLAGYIFGNNAKGGASQKISMTSPVLMTTTNAYPPGGVGMTSPVLTRKEVLGSTSMAFILPSRYQSLQDLPVPGNAQVKLLEVPEHKVAVMKFSGVGSDALWKSKELELRRAAAQEGVALSSEPDQVVRAMYNPPWTLPPFRTNEVMIPVL